MFKVHDLQNVYSFLIIVRGKCVKLIFSRLPCLESVSCHRLGMDETTSCVPITPNRGVDTAAGAKPQRFAALQESQPT
jgi:hypothetical protein